MKSGTEYEATLHCFLVLPLPYFFCSCRSYHNPSKHKYWRRSKRCGHFTSPFIAVAERVVMLCTAWERSSPRILSVWHVADVLPCQQFHFLVNRQLYPGLLCGPKNIITGSILLQSSSTYNIDKARYVIQNICTIESCQWCQTSHKLATHKNSRVVRFRVANIFVVVITAMPELGQQKSRDIVGQLDNIKMCQYLTK